MQSVKPLLLLLLTCYLLSCAPANPAATKIGSERTSNCGEIPVGVATDKQELDLAGAKLGDFSLGKLNIKSTPEFQKIITDAATNALVQDYIACKAIERAGVGGDPEMVDYFTRMTHFFSQQPTIDEQTKWRAANPFPKRKGKETAKLEPVDDDMKIYLECEYKQFVKVIPADGPYFVLLSPSSNMISDLIQARGTPGQANMFSDPEKNGGYGHVCQLTNYGNDPIFKIEISLALRFKEPIITHPGQPITGGATRQVTIWNALIKKVEGREGSFVFYLINNSPHFLEVEFPARATLYRFGDVQRRTVKLLYPFGPPTLNMRPLKYPLGSANS